MLTNTNCTCNLVRAPDDASNLRRSKSLGLDDAEHNSKGGVIIALSAKVSHQHTIVWRREEVLGGARDRVRGLSHEINAIANGGGGIISLTAY